MVQWKNTSDAANSVNYGASTLGAGSGKSNRASNNTALFKNTTPNAFVKDMVVGQFGVEVAAMANTSGEAKKVTHPGWVLRREGVGGIQSVTLTGLSGVTNGETISVTGGDANAVLALTSNATGNVASAKVTTPGLFPNTSVMTFTPNREKHVSVLTYTNTAATPVTGYANTDYIVIAASNTSQQVAQATANIVTNGSGVFTNANFTINASGQFLQAISNAASNVTINIYAANGAASNGTGIASFGVVFANSAGSLASNTAVLGGRAGRVHYETLVAMGSMKNGAGSNTTQLPIT